MGLHNSSNESLTITIVFCVTPLLEFHENAFCSEVTKLCGLRHLVYLGRILIAMLVVTIHVMYTSLHFVSFDWMGVHNLCLLFV
jgi:hypothetical protein